VVRHEDIQLADYKRKWNFIFQMLPELPAELAHGKKDLYVAWWFKNKAHTPGVIPPPDGAAYVASGLSSSLLRCRQPLAQLIDKDPYIFRVVDGHTDEMYASASECPL
jgi:hypothetical protein